MQKKKKEIGCRVSDTAVEKQKQMVFFIFFLSYKT